MLIHIQFVTASSFAVSMSPVASYMTKCSLHNTADHNTFSLFQLLDVMLNVQTPKGNSHRLSSSNSTDKRVHMAFVFPGQGYLTRYDSL